MLSSVKAEGNVRSTRVAALVGVAASLLVFWYLWNHPEFYDFVK